MSAPLPAAIEHSALKVVAHPIRLAVWDELERGVASPTELADRLDEPLGNVSYHVRLMKDLGAIELVRTMPRRGAVEHWYGISDAEIVPMVRRQLALMRGDRDALAMEAKAAAWDTLSKQLDENAAGRASAADVCALGFSLQDRVREALDDIESDAPTKDGPGDVAAPRAPAREE